MNLIIENKTINLCECNNFFNRLIGNMFKKNIKNLIFKRCNSIHTFFMKKNIDVIFLDKNFKVLYIYKNLKPWKIILPKKNVYYVIELEENTIKNLKINETIKTAKI